MGGSYESDLKSGNMKDVSKLLQHAVETIDEAASDFATYVYMEDQMDNAAQSGGALNQMRIASGLLSELIP